MDLKLIYNKIDHIERSQKKLARVVCDLEEGGGGTGEGLTQSQVNALIASAPVNNNTQNAINTRIPTNGVKTINGVSIVGSGDIITPLTTSASSITSGTLADGRLSTNVLLRDASQIVTNKTFSGLNNTFSNIDQSSITNLTADLASKQPTLVSGTTLKTINGESLLGNGNITITAGTGSPPTTDASQLITGTLNDARLSGNVLLINSTQTVTNKTFSGASNTFNNISQNSITNLVSDLSGKQVTLVSGTNIKTINGQSILGGGDIVISGGGSATTDASQLTTGILNNDRLQDIPQAKVLNLVSDLSGKAPNVLTGYTSGAGTISATDTVLSAIQKLNGNDALKANLASPSFTGTVTLPSTTSIGNVSATEIGYIDGLSSSIQTQLDSKLASTLAATTYQVLSNLSTDLTESTTKYPSVNAVNTGLGTREPTIAAGTTSQYWRGDKTWQTLTIPTNADYVDRTTAQTIGGIKTFSANTIIGGSLTVNTVPALGSAATTVFVNNAGVLSTRTISELANDLGVTSSANFVDLANPQTINGVKTFSAAPTLAGITVTGNILPDAATTYDIGSSGARFNNIYASTFISSTSVTYGGAATNALIRFRQGTASQFIGGFQSGGNFYLQAAGAVPTDITGMRLQVYGNVALPTASSYIQMTASNGAKFNMSINTSGAWVTTAA